MNVNRRGFLGLAACAGAFGLSGCKGFPAIVSRKSPNGVLRFGAIGCGSQGQSDISRFKTHKRIEMAAFCDVDRAILDTKIAKDFPKAALYQDWRAMLDREDLDAVLVATPDHSHALIMEDVMRRGIHLYAQKPLCRTLDEIRRLEEAAAASGVVTQLGTQIAPWQCDRYTAELIRSGRIGTVKKVWLFSSTGVYLNLVDRSKPIVTAPVPKTLDWKAWLEGAPERPYSDEIYHPFRWRVWRDFGSGWLGDMGSHLFSPVWLGMELGKSVPTRVTAEVMDDGWTAEQRRQFLPQVAHVTWEFPGVKATGGKPFEVEWFDGPKNWKKFPIPEKFLPPKRLEELAAKTPYGKLPMQGRVVEGTEGVLFSTHFNVEPVILKTSGGAEGEAFVAKNDGTFEMKMPYQEPVQSHYHDFIECCLDGGTPLSSFDWTTKLTETIVRGNMAINSKQKKG